MGGATGPSVVAGRGEGPVRGGAVGVGFRGAGGVGSSDGVVLGIARARGIENRPWGRDWRRGGSAMPCWRGGGERVFSRLKQFTGIERPRTQMAERVRRHVLWRLIGMVLLALTAHHVGKRRSALSFASVV